ncbi:EamA family transporter [Limimaricola hongkongensis]|uniref:Integral membrane protein n=1 Tax=Limimaricola hongkongensis DSM 17492 TaxID=1122180 RepID=A0A017HE63_9RHOB|nr:EamA family transporter [Limimaricola hongkongensis]EYD72651.1 Integral membrane protein [Limimaricola hongkongensis DSM 17492]
MSLPVFLAVMLAALLHASWNAMIKLGASKVAGMVILALVQGVMGLAVALTRPFPEAEVWPWVAASAICHAVYNTFLAFAYEHGDLSRVYPIARGAAPMAVLVASALFLSDAIEPMSVAGVLVLGLGILGMARGALGSGESRRLIPYALGAAAGTAGYTLVDGLGARVSGDPIAYVGWLFVAQALLFPPMAFAMRGRGLLRVSARVWGQGALAAVASYGAYAIAVWAMTLAPIALVSALRETSILFAVLIGWAAFGDRMDRTKAVSAALIVSGVVLTRL